MFWFFQLYSQYCFACLRPNSIVALGLSPLCNFIRPLPWGHRESHTQYSQLFSFHCILSLLGDRRAKCYRNAARRRARTNALERSRRSETLKWYLLFRSSRALIHHKPYQYRILAHQIPHSKFYRAFLIG